MALAILGNIATTARGVADAPLARGHPCEQISVRSPTLRVRFGLISNEFRREAFPQKNRAVTLKSNECAVWPAAPAPHPHNERPFNMCDIDNADELR